MDAYHIGDDSLTVEHTTAVLNETQSGDGATQAYYLRGMARYRQKDFDAAEEDLQAAHRLSRDDVLAAKAADALGELAYLRGDLVGAAARFQETVERLPKGRPPTDHAHFRLGCILQRQGRWRDADIHFQRIMLLFDGSPLAELARRRALARAWTIQVGSFRKKANADAEAQRYEEFDLPMTVSPGILDGKPVFLVQLGRWDDHAAAQRALPTVRAVAPEAFVSVTR
jgi:tetratricopeptide (TPR) repeat protein